MSSVPRYMTGLRKEVAPIIREILNDTRNRPIERRRLSRKLWIRCVHVAVAEIRREEPELCAIC